ncbi:hypothetical protein [Mesorhizobium muleiense]|uniref:Uncharacterized protein n=1 Tax=Mesorhizobium muleiense TaxID=1004279 RepID=A0A1G8V0M8_9HYPH|nr:hypothetical protein [Mesorhizobium muleiense]MCF6102400.1 hypothetical protein [Mesorhizobium muleiense]SDJ58895.1 hypothetical protein SAMN05428953_107144 [Mesorhizobium muleiense]
MLKWLKQVFLRPDKKSFMMFPPAERPAALQAEYEAVFSEAKKFSDFVGMVIRIAFLLLATAYFGYKIPTSSFPYKISMIICAAISFVMTAVITINTMKVILLWVSDLAIAPPNIWARFFVFVMIGLVVFSFMVGLIYFTGDVVSSSTLLPHFP